MRRTLWVVMAAAVAAGAGCARWFRPDPMPRDPAIQLSAQPTGPSAVAPDTEDLYAAMPAVAGDSAALDRETWPWERLELGRPVLPRTLVPLQNRAECATGPEPASYWQCRDLVPAARSVARLAVDLLLLPVTLPRPRPAPAPAVAPTPYAAAPQ